MAQKELQTVITLSGRVDNSVGRMGNALLTLGNQVDGISQKLISAGKEAKGLYTEYDDIMREVQGLGEYDRKTLSFFDEYNKELGQNSKYLMANTANAEKLIAQLGLGVKDAKELLSIVPGFATAGKIEMEKALNYLYYTNAALDKPISNTRKLADQLSKTAAASAADIDTLGESMQRLGSVSQFYTGGSSEILAILGGISKFGADMQGSNAGTQLRNFMLTLLAPTKGKGKILEELKLSAEEMADFENYLEDSDINLTDTAAAMEEMGFSAYDANGNLKSGIQIIADLDKALSKMSAEKRNTTLGQLFGKRTTTTAKNLISSLDEIVKLNDVILNQSEGYTRYLEETMESGAGGLQRRLEASKNTLMVIVGEHVAGKLEGLYEGAIDVFNSISGMDEKKLDALVSGLGTIATIGPGLIAAGAGLRLFGMLLRPTGIAGMAVMTLLAGANALQAYKEMLYKENFGGDMDLDEETMHSYISGISLEFSKGREEIDKFSKALEDSVISYQDASSAFSQNLLQNVLTKNQLSENEVTELKSLGEQMYKSLVSGIQNGTAERMNLLNVFFGGPGVAENNPAYQSMLGAENKLFTSSMLEAAKVGEDLSTALTEAMYDREITQEEKDKIYAYVLQMNQIMAEAERKIADRNSFVDRSLLLKKAQTLGYGAITETSGEAMQQRNKDLERLQLDYYKASAMNDYDLQQSIISAEQHRINQEQIDSDYALNKARSTASYDDLIYGIFHEVGQSSAFGDAYSALASSAASFVSGVYDENTFKGIWRGNNDLKKYIGQMAANLGGAYGIGAKISGYENAGNTAMANKMKMMYAMLNLMNNFDTVENMANSVEASGKMPNWQIALFKEASKRVTEIPSGMKTDYGHAWWEYQVGKTEGLLHGTPLVVKPVVRKNDIQAQLNDANAELPVKIRLRPSYGHAVSGGNDRIQMSLLNSDGTFKVFAEGGRADTPSIFGEAGAEYAIPVAHSPNTARLLNQARQESGFSWPELITYTSGGNSSGSGQIIYSPTIYANDVSGLEEELIMDKERLKKVLLEMKMHRELEAFT